ncbi:uncharacterized protein LOC134695076 isoform X2 [Mytilus trossulus]|uniref:uncharacterized protein LOC134695076 isoform X2 n=1 Tax=Mytilus trossulus TaxID=6551 RepID=UPI003007874B
MTCSVYTDKIEVTWYKDDQELPKCTNILITSKGNHRTLTILKATVPETGTYFVKAQNAEMKISLTVKAVFKQRLVDITIMEGLDTNLECETMEKSCTVQWFKNNGEKIDQPDRKTIKTTQGRIHTLSISETRREDSGTYSIKIKDVTSIAKLDVKEMPGTIKLMSMHDREQFLRAAKSGITKRYNVRVMIVGEKSVGKTCLLRRLMDENIENVTSTDGIDIDRRKCKIDLETEEWHFLSGGEPKGSSDDNKQYADCGFWDFAGQKEFYATHQTFLSANAVYLLVVDISKDFAAKTYNKMIEREFDSIGEYIDFWLDNIHCYSRDDSNTSKHHNENNLLNPPVIIVGTGIDKLSEVEGKKKDFKHYLSRILSNHAKRRHLRKPHFVSNSHPSDDKHEFKSLREDIFRQAKALTTWGDNLPTRWIVLEKEINTKSHEHYISYTDAERLAKSCSFHDDCQLTVDLDSFLRFEHDIGNIIFFKDLKSFIILDPKWLVDIFRCFVSHQYADDTLGFTEWTALEKTGELADKLIEKFLEKVPDLNTPELKKFALQIMEKFDIIVRSINYEDRNNFYMPCMIKAEPIHNIIGISESQNDRRTSWFCLKFNFLPPSYFNHILVSFRENKELFHEEKKLLRIYRNFGEFRFDKDGKKTLLICLSKNAIAMQVRQSNCTEGVCFSDVKKTLIEIVNSVKQRYGINITYTIKFKCSDGIYFCKRIDLETLMETDEYQCREHKIMHSSKEIYSSWLSEEEVDTQSKNNIHRRCNNCKIKSVYKCFDCKIFLCKDCSRKHNDDDKYLSHSMHLTSDRFSLTSKFKMEEKCIRDIICLLNGDIVVAYSSQLMKYSVSGKQRVVIQLQSSPYKLVVVDKNNVAVLLEYYTMAIVDIQQKHITYISNIAIQNGLDSLTYIENQFYVEVESGIAVLDMSGSVKRRITLSFTPYIICYYVDSKRIYCLDRDNSKLICIDRDGTIVFTCAVSDSTNLQDLTIDKKGNVLALYRKGDDNSAYAIKVDFTDKSSEIEITDIKMSTYRSCMCFNHLTNSIVIASDNEVYIYKKK